jgi:type IX secretion system PorP/SprF family membrane protein
MNLKVLTILSLIVLTFLPGMAQQQPMISQYMINKYMVNPAFAGVSGYTSINMTARRQYSGFQNAPQTFLFSAETRLLEDSWILKRQKVEKKTMRASRAKHVGLGGYIFNDKNGIISRTGMGLTYGYHININNSYQISFGLSVTGYQFKLDDEGAFILDDQDPLLLANKKNFLSQMPVQVYTFRGGDSMAAWLYPSFSVPP